MQEKIAERAYYNFLNRGSQHGSDLEDWYKAEQEVLAEAGSGKKSTRTRKKATTTRKRTKKA